MADVGERRTINGQLAEWDGQGWVAVTGEKKASARTWTDTAVDALPMAGGALGGIVGGIGGTVAGLGVGGVPGAIGGATLGGAFGEAGKQLVNRARGQAAPPTMTDAALDIGKEGAIQGAMEGAGQAAMPVVKAGAEAVYRGYLKPSLSRVNLPKATQIVKAAIAEGLPVTAGGVQQANAIIGQLKGKVDTLLSQATGKTVDLSQIANDVRAWATRMYDRPGRDPRDLKAALAVADRIDAHPSVNPSSMGNQMAGKTAATADMTTANQVKRDLQGSARDKFGVPGGTAETAAEKYGSATARKAIEAQVPDVGPLNAREGRLLDVARSINQAVGRESNRNQFFGMPSLLAGAAGSGEYARSGDPTSAAVAALAARFALHPAVATRAAILASQMADRIPGAAVSDVARVAIQAVLETQHEAGGDE